MASARRFGGGAEVELLAQRVDFEHEAVGGYLSSSFRALSQWLMYASTASRLLSRVIASDTLNPHDRALLHVFVVGVAWQIVAYKIVEVGVEAASGHFGRVEQLQRA